MVARPKRSGHGANHVQRGSALLLRTSVAALLLVAALALLNAGGRGATSTAFIGSGGAPGAADKGRLRRRGRRNVAVRFFDRIQMALGWREDPEKVEKDLEEMVAKAKAATASDLESLRGGRERVMADQEKLVEAKALLSKRREEAFEQCEVRWEADEVLWDDTVGYCAKPYAEQYQVAKDLLGKLRASVKALRETTTAAESGVAERRAAAEARVDELEKEDQAQIEDLPAKLEAASGGSDAERLRILTLAKAETTDAMGEAARSEMLLKELDSDDLLKKLLDRCVEIRDEIRDAEKARAAAAAEAKSKAEAEAAKAAAKAAKMPEEAEDEDSSAATTAVGAVALLAGAAGAFWYTTH